MKKKRALDMWCWFRHFSHSSANDHLLQIQHCAKLLFSCRVHDFERVLERLRVNYHAGGDFRLYLNPVSVRVFGMIDTQDGEDGSHCIPHTVLYKPTTRTNAPAMAKGKMVDKMVLQLPISCEMASGIEA